MKKKILYILGIAVITSYSCQKSMLTPVSQTQISNQDGQPFATSDRIVAQVKGLYAQLKGGDFYGGRYIVYNEIRGENWLNSTSNGVTGLQTWNFSVNSGNQEVTGLWSRAYSTINYCNLFIEGMAQYGNAVVGTTSGNQYVAEAKFLRALSYYSLLQLYARPYFDGNGSKPAVPLRLKGNSSFDNYDLAKSTTGEIYTQILADLNAAETGLPATYGDATNNTTRAHINTAIALKTRVYLSMQNYAGVITEGNKLVPLSAPFTAKANVANTMQADPATVFTNYVTTESILSMPFQGATEVPGTQNQLGFYFNRTGSGEYYLNPGGIIANTAWKATDKRRTAFIGSTSTRSYSKKYAVGSPYTDWVPVMRWPEVLLNLAEARARTAVATAAPDAQALALLNEVRRRSDATTTFAPTTNADLIDLILTERNIEFLGEGLRGTDITRLGLTFPAKSNVVSAVPASSSSYIWPISNNELLYNPLIGGSNN